MALDGLDLARWQFAITTVYHFILVPLTIGLSPLVALMEALHLRTGDEQWRVATKFFGKILLINFEGAIWRSANRERRMRSSLPSGRTICCRCIVDGFVILTVETGLSLDSFDPSLLIVDVTGVDPRPEPGWLYQPDRTPNFIAPKPGFFAGSPSSPTALSASGAPDLAFS